ncbi:hypothetical protein [Olleya sp. R77988]|uniref:hypothetical protein n=1 Tax=Olleya sp. R77988 TaxID=3093875 RepID=UPI0037C7EC17
MKRVILKQFIPFRQKLVVVTGLFFIGTLLNDKYNEFLGVLFYVLGILFFFVNYNLVITKGFLNYYQFRIFNISLFKIKKELLFPDYVSLFNQSFVQSNHVGFSPDILGDSKYRLYTIKFFKGHKNEILFTSKNRVEVVKLGTQLSTMFNVELHNTLK